MPSVLEYRSQLCAKVFDLISDEQFCDVKIRAKDQSFFCHKIILAAASPLLRGIMKDELTTDVTFGGQLELCMQYLSSEVVENLLQYVYTGDCTDSIKDSKAFKMMIKFLLDPQYSSLSSEEVEHLVRQQTAAPMKFKIEALEGSTAVVTREETKKTQLESVDQKGPYYIIQLDKSGKFSFLSPQQKSRLSLPRKPPFLCPCQNCGKIFETFERLRSHYRHNHGEKKYKCSQCPLRFLYPKDLKCHMRTHTGEKPFICEICGKGFAQVCSLRMHIKVHEKLEKATPCLECKKRYCRKEKPASSLDIADCDLTSLRCPNNFCAKKFMSRKTLRKHILNHVCKPAKVYCAQCSTRYDTMLLLKQHIGKRHCTHKKKLNQVRNDSSWKESGMIVKDPFADELETTVMAFDTSVIENTENGAELGFEQVESNLELCGEVEMDIEDVNGGSDL